MQCMLFNSQEKKKNWKTTLPHGKTKQEKHKKHMGSPPVISGVRGVAQPLVFCVVFCRSLLALLSFFFCSLSSIYGFWLPFGIFKLFLNTCLFLLGIVFS
jgi:hypothetical protein